MKPERFHSEHQIDNFSKYDGTVRFYGFVHAIIGNIDSPTKVLEFGAGRGSFYYESKSEYRKYLQNLKNVADFVVAADIDEVVMTHPCSDSQIVLQSGKTYPFENSVFDVIVSDVTFEHIDNPTFVSAELLRILKPGGWICARTPNKLGYVKLFTQLVPNKLHVKLLKYIQPDRLAQDVFPTRYKLNSPRDVKTHFQNCETLHYYHSGTPAYFFGNSVVYYIFLILHKFIPQCFSTTLCLFIKKLE